MFSCLLCQSYLGFEGEWCQYCQNLLPWNQHCCMRCGDPWNTPFTGLCAQCVHTEPEFDLCHAPFIYDFPVDQLLLSGKSGQRPELLFALARALASSVQQLQIIRPQLLVPIPLHPQRQQRRGYNQAGIIAAILGRKLNIPVDYSVLRKIRDTNQQKELSRLARLDNLRRAFRVERTILRERYSHVSHITLIDDVVTTGSTLNQIAGQLRRSGVERVDGWAIARTRAIKSSSN